MATVNVDNLEFCPDCVQVIANGEGTDAHVGEMIELWGEGINGMMGLVLDMPDDGSEYEPWFAWSACDGCGSTLGGDRFKGAHLIQ
jgi:hypothetical protein